MARMGKCFCLCLVAILVVSSMLMINSTYAQTTSRPTVPEFRAKFTTSSLEVTINNQPISDSENTDTEKPHLYYGFRFKNPNSIIGNWEYDPIYFVGTSSYGTYYKASASDYTVISFPVDEYPFDGINHHTGISKNGPVEMQVIALIGIEIPTTEQNGSVYRFEGETSDWSPTQTITISDESVSPSPSPTVPEFPSLLFIPLLISVLAGALVMRKKQLSKRVANVH